MRAVALEVAGPEPRLAMRYLPTPSVGDYDVLVQVAACGFCHHDLLVMEGVLRRGVNLPLIPGHEVAGQVVEVGPKVTAVQPGDRVVCLLAANGGMAQFVSVRETGLVKIPSSIGWIESCLLACPVGVAIKGVEKAQIQAGETVVVTGAGGGLGVHLVQLARNRGARVLAVTSSKQSRNPSSRWEPMR